MPIWSTAWQLKSTRTQKFTAFGGLCLNHPVGGLNPDAVETSLKLGAKVIWLPTNTAENHYRKTAKTPQGRRRHP